MRGWRGLFILGWLVLGLGLGPGASLAVTPYDDVLVQQAVKNIQQENYDEALGQLTESCANRWQAISTHTTLSPQNGPGFGVGDDS